MQAVPVPSISPMKKKKKKKKYKVSPRSLANLTGRPGPVAPPPVVPAAWDTFCIQYKLTGKLSKASVRAGFHPDYGRLLLRHPRIQARLQEVSQEMLDKALTDAAKEYVLHEELLDEHLVTVIRSHAHERRGYSDKVAAIRHGNELLGRVASGKTTINNTANAQARSTAGKNAIEIYEAGWLTRKKENWDKQLEGKYGDIEITAE